MYGIASKPIVEEHGRLARYGGQIISQ